ncbi:MAG: DUF362 domain-containing protein [Candidatus Bathyarchaeia archaeon]
MIYCRLRSSGGGRESMVVKVGVIGCGAALEKHHLPAIRDLPGVKVKALADVNERRIEKVVRKFGLRDVETYTDHRQLLKCANIDAVWILTPPETHAHMIIDAIGHGKHVLCEKPIAMSTKEAKLVKDALEQNIWSRRLILMPAHNFIFTPCFEGAVEYVKREGLIGEVKEIYGRAISNLLFYKAVTDFRLRAKGGVAEDLLPHVIYLSQDLCGRVERIRFVSPHSEGQSITEDIDVEVEFDGGAKGVLSAAWSSSIPYFKFSIKGSSGSIFMDLLRTPFTLTLVKDGEKKTIHFGRRFTQYLDVLVGNHPSYRNEHAHFVNVIEGLEELRVNVDDGLNLSRTLELIVDAIEERPKVTVRHNERVSIVKFDGNLEASVRRAIELLGGLNVPRDAKVVIKPNVCFWKNTNGMIITDPRLLEAVLKIVKERTSRITVVESDNNSGTAEKRLEKSGVMDIVKRCKVEFMNLSRDECEEHEVAGFKLHVPKTVLNADFLINLPKIKTCNVANTVISISMKNMFGVLSDRRKTVFHKNLLDVLLHLNKIIRQDLIIVDGIIGMEGLGPVWGNPVNLNLIIAGFNPVTVDAVCCKIMGINPYSVSLLWKAYKTGMGEIDVNRVEILGEKIENVEKRFSRPTLMMDNIVGLIRSTLKTYF